MKLVEGRLFHRNKFVIDVPGASEVKQKRFENKILALAVWPHGRSQLFCLDFDGNLIWESERMFDMDDHFSFEVDKNRKMYVASFYYIYDIDPDSGKLIDTWPNR